MMFFDTFKRVKELYTYRHEPEYMRPLGEIFWHGLLFFTAVGAVAVLVFAASVFVDVLTTLGGAPTGTSRPPVVLDRASLDAMLHRIDEKVFEYETHRASSTPVVDPSR